MLLSRRSPTYGAWGLSCLVALTCSLVATPVDPASAATQGGRVAYACGNRGFCTSELDGSGRRVFTRTPFTGVRNPEWSFDGRSVAWADLSSPGAGGDIFVADAATGSVRQITDHGYSEDPAWLRDGQIVYSRNRADGSTYSDLWTIDPVTGSEQALPDAGFCRHHSPTVSPDGTKVAFVGVTWTEPHRPQCGEDRPNGIYVVALGSSAASPIIPQEFDEVLSRVTFDPVEPDWSPDGNRIAFANFEDVWTAATNGSDRRRLTRFGDIVGNDDGDLVDASSPRWSVDGSGVLFYLDDNRDDEVNDGIHFVSSDGLTSIAVVDGDHFSGADQQPCPDEACPAVFMEERTLPGLTLSAYRSGGTNGDNVDRIEVEANLKPAPRFEDDSSVRFKLLRKSGSRFKPAAQMDVYVDSTQVIGHFVAPRGTCKVVASFGGSTDLLPRRAATKPFPCRQ